MPNANFQLHTFLCLVDFRQEARLLGGQHEGQDGQDDGVEDEDDGEDVGPSQAAHTDVVFVRCQAAHPSHRIAVPAVRIDHTPQEHADSCTAPKEMDGG